VTQRVHPHAAGGVTRHQPAKHGQVIKQKQNIHVKNKDIQRCLAQRQEKPSKRLLNSNLEARQDLVANNQHNQIVHQAENAQRVLEEVEIIDADELLCRDEGEPIRGRQRRGTTP
jgi:hypothetical protein